MPKLDAFTDNFATGISAAKWTLSPYEVAYDSAQQVARMFLSSTTLCTMTSAGGYVQDLTASYVYARLNFPTDRSVYDVRFQLIASPGNNSISMRVNNGVFTCFVVNTGTQTTLFTANYDPTIHGPWWRMREAAGTVYFDTSADGVTWVNRATVATPAFANAVYLYIYGANNDTSLTIPLASMTVDNVNTGFPVASDPWVLITGPKGPTGTPLPMYSFPPSTQGPTAAGASGTAPPLGQPPNTAFRRYAAPNGTNSGLGWDGSGFVFGANWANYSPGTGIGHSRLQAVRTPQGIATFSGLLMYSSAAAPGQVFSLPWDMYPNPNSAEWCTVCNVNNQRGRMDVLRASNAMYYQVNDSAVTITSGVFVAVQFSVPVLMPQVWVDYGMKTDLALSQGLAQWTVGPGQMSGFVKGAPVTIANPTVLTLQAPWSYPNNWPYLYYDLVTQQLGIRTFTTSTTGAFGTWFSPDIWMGLANEGKVCLATIFPLGGASAVLMDRRFFIRGPLDTFSGLPS